MTSTNDQAAAVAEEAVETPNDKFYCGLCRGWVDLANYARHGHEKKGN